MIYAVQYVFYYMSSPLIIFSPHPVLVLPYLSPLMLCHFRSIFAA